MACSPREATIQAMEQVSGPVIAVGLVLSAVFVPCAFISGITGSFFRQFALTIAVSTVISAFNSLTLSPALTAVLLRPRDKGSAPPLPRLAFPLAGAWLGWMVLGPRVVAALGPPASAAWIARMLPWAVPRCPGSGRWRGWLVSRGCPQRGARPVFPRISMRASERPRVVMSAWSAACCGSALLVLVVYGGLLGLTYLQFEQTPRGFIPSQDMGYLLVNVQLPDSASSERTAQVMRQIEQIALEDTGYQARHGHRRAVVRAQCRRLELRHHVRQSQRLSRAPTIPRLSSEAIADRAAHEELAANVREAQMAVFGPPPVRGVGRAGGFTMMVEDRGDLGPAALQSQTENLVEKGRRGQFRHPRYVLGVPRQCPAASRRA